jgi:hypothetical protein
MMLRKILKKFFIPYRKLIKVQNAQVSDTTGDAMKNQSSSQNNS